MSAHAKKPDNSASARQIGTVDRVRPFAVVATEANRTAMATRTAKRPRSVAAFETLSIICLVLELVFGPGFTWDDLIWAPLMLWIVLSVTRRKSSVARWIFTLLYGLGVALLASIIAVGMVGPSDLKWTGWGLTLVGVVQLAMLWSQGTSRWIASRRFDAMQPQPVA